MNTLLRMRVLLMAGAPAAMLILAGAAETARGAAAPGPDSSAPFTGNKGSRKIHLSSCVWAQKISPGKRKYFATYQEAAAQGYVPCSTCKPELAAGLPESPPPQFKDTDIVASKLRHFFHRGSCPWARKITADHLLIYRTREEALKGGKHPCRYCAP